MPRVYLETSFISYLVARPSRDLIRAARQQITLEWWGKERANHELFASEVVMREARRGDLEEIAKRMAVLSDVQILDVPEPAANLAVLLVKQHALPAQAAADALHIAVATVHSLDYLLTWNCKHIANLTKRGAIEQTCRAAGHRYAGRIWSVKLWKTLLLPNYTSFVKSGRHNSITTSMLLPLTCGARNKKRIGRSSIYRRSASLPDASRSETATTTH